MTSSVDCGSSSLMAPSTLLHIERAVRACVAVSAWMYSCVRADERDGGQGASMRKDVTQTRPRGPNRGQAPPPRSATPNGAQTLVRWRRQDSNHEKKTCRYGTCGRYQHFYPTFTPTPGSQTLVSRACTCTSTQTRAVAAVWLRLAPHGPLLAPLRHTPRAAARPMNTRLPGQGVPRVPLPITRNPMNKRISRPPGLFSLWVPLGLASRPGRGTSAALCSTTPDLPAIPETERARLAVALTIAQDAAATAPRCREPLRRSPGRLLERPEPAPRVNSPLLA